MGTVEITCMNSLLRLIYRAAVATNFHAKRKFFLKHVEKRGFVFKTAVVFLSGNHKTKLKTGCHWKSSWVRSKCAEGLMFTKENFFVEVSYPGHTSQINLFSLTPFKLEKQAAITNLHHCWVSDTVWIYRLLWNQLFLKSVTIRINNNNIP